MEVGDFLLDEVMSPFLGTRNIGKQEPVVIGLWSGRSLWPLWPAGLDAGEKELLWCRLLLRLMMSEAGPHSE